MFGEALFLYQIKKWHLNTMTTKDKIWMSAMMMDVLSLLGVGKVNSRVPLWGWRTYSTTKISAYGVLCCPCSSLKFEKYNVLLPQLSYSILSTTA
jgi:hypothetical protein